MEVLKFLLLTVLFCKGVFGVGFTTPDTDPDTATNTVAEDAAAGFVVETLEGDGSTMEYAIVSEDGSTEASAWHFEVDVDKIKVKANAGLNFEEKKSYVLIVKVTDTSDSSTATAALTVTITDVNEKPMFAEDREPACISSSSSSGAAVGTWVATDPDTDSSASNGDVSGYGIGDSGAGGRFDISNAGVVTRGSTALDPATKSYFLSLEANDGALTGTALVVVYIDNDARCNNNGAPGLKGGLIGLATFVIFMIYQIL